MGKLSWKEKDEARRWEYCFQGAEGQLKHGIKAPLYCTLVTDSECVHGVCLQMGDEKRLSA